MSDVLYVNVAEADCRVSMSDAESVWGGPDWDDRKHQWEPVIPLSALKEYVTRQCYKGEVPNRKALGTYPERRVLMKLVRHFEKAGSE